jgi:hypothetical protein
MALPASIVLLGLFVDAFQARGGTGSKACFLRSRESRRWFAGTCRSRNWCCPLTAFLDFLVERGVVDMERAPAGKEMLFFVFASSMEAWDAVAPLARAPLRAHLRFAALDIGMKLSLLDLAGFNFGLRTRDECDVPAWADQARRAEPLRELRRQAGTQSAMADKICCSEHTVSGWFSRGVRPSDTQLGYIAQLHARFGLGDAESVERELLVHYSLGDLLSLLTAQHRAIGGRAWLPPDEVSDLAGAMSRSLGCAARSVVPVAAEAILVAAFSTPPRMWLDNFLDHGASPAWVDDCALAKRDYEMAGVISSGSDYAVPAERVARLFEQLPGARPRVMTQRKRAKASTRRRARPPSQ